MVYNMAWIRFLKWLRLTNTVEWRNNNNNRLKHNVPIDTSAIDCIFSASHTNGYWFRWSISSQHRHYVMTLCIATWSQSIVPICGLPQTLRKNVLRFISFCFIKKRHVCVCVCESLGRYKQFFFVAVFALLRPITGLFWRAIRPVRPSSARWSRRKEKMCSALNWRRFHSNFSSHLTYHNYPVVYFIIDP